MVTPDDNWTASFSQRLALLSKDRIEADVILWVGSLQIPAHKFVLDATTDILKTDDVCYKAADGQFHVILQREFEEKFDLLGDLITSLYTGCVDVGEDDAKFAYKFAKICNVEWLKKKTLALLAGMLNESSFIDIFQFAHSICCEDLKGMCLEYLTPNLMEVLSKTGDILNIDYHSLCSIMNADVVSEMNKFQIVCRWFEFDVSMRICHLDKLIHMIKFNAVKKSDLCVALDWLLKEQNIDDGVRMNLLKEINLRANTPTTETTEFPHRDVKELRNLKQQTLTKMKNILSGSIKEKEEKQILFTDYCSIVRNFYSGGDSVTKQIIIEFLVKHWMEMITKNSITDLVGLNKYDCHLFSFSMLDVLTLQEFKWFRELIPSMSLKTFSFDSLRKFVGALQPLGTARDNDAEYRILDIRIVECIMGWLLQNPQNGDTILELMSSSVCLCHLPNEYIDFVLKPYILIMTSGKKFSYQCYRHETQYFEMEKDVLVQMQNLQLFKLSSYYHELTSKIYSFLMKDTLPSHRFGQYTYTPNFDPERKHLFQLGRYNHNGGYYDAVFDNPKFILFDKEQGMEKYPVWATCDLNLNELREIVLRYKKLCVMFFNILE